MRFTNSKQFVKGNLSGQSLLIPFSSEIEKSEDDSLSIRSFSITFLGIFLASITILVPSIIVFLGRPLSQDNEITFSYLIKKDGS